MVAKASAQWRISKSNAGGEICKEREQAKQAKPKTKEKKKGKAASSKEHACAKATLSKELASFKAIARYILKKDAKPQHQATFMQHTGSQKWRLKEFVVIGQHPAISATKNCTPSEIETVETAIMQQRIGGGKSQVKDIRSAIKEWHQNGSVYRTMLRWTPIDFLSTIRWKRQVSSETTTGQPQKHIEMPRY